MPISQQVYTGHLRNAIRSPYLVFLSILRMLDMTFTYYSTYFLFSSFFLALMVSPSVK